MLINMTGPYNETGYGLHFRNLLEAVVRREGEDVTWFSIGPVQGPMREDVGKAYYQVRDWDPSAPSVRLFHEFDMALFPGHYRIGYPVFETNRMKKSAIHQLAKCDEVLVTSRWAKSVILSISGLPNIPVHVVPEGVSKDFFTSVGETGIKSDDSFKFLHIGKYEIRKNQDLIVEAFARAFPTDKYNVSLIMLVNNPWNMSGTDIFKINAAQKHPRIVFIDRIAYKTLIALMHECDCGVFASRAEGWNLPLLELMAAGKPVITTNNTGMTEFVTDKNSMIIPSGNLVRAVDGFVFDGTGEWYDPPLDPLVEAMREAYDIGKTTNQDGIITAQRYSWDNAADTLCEVFAHD